MAYSETDNNFENVDNILNQFDDDELWNMLDICVSQQNDSITKGTKTDKISNNYCRVCKNPTMVFNSNESVYNCDICGAVSNEVFDQKPEWNNYDDGPQDNGRCGSATNPFFPTSSIGTIITGAGCGRLRLIQKWDQMPYKERALSNVLNHIESNMKTCKMTKAIIDNAKILYKNVSELKHTDGPNKGKNIIIRGFNRSGLIAACAFYGAKLQNMPRSTKEIANIFGLKVTQVTKGCRKFLELHEYKNGSYSLSSSHAQDFIERNGYKLKLLRQHIDMAIKIAENVTKLDIASDHQPTSLAAGSILLVIDIHKLPITKKQISDVFEISEVTITKTFKKINPMKNILLDDKFSDLVLKKINSKISKGLINKNTNIQNKKITTNDITTSLDILNCNDTNNLASIFVMPDDTESDENNTEIKNDNLSIESIDLMYLNSVNGLSLNTSHITVNIDKLEIEQTKRKRGRPRKNKLVDSSEGLEI
jgi:transcription initiation factor TFIIIB Brf1 subunit/transcription initiation factor TFIIB